MRKIEGNKPVIKVEVKNTPSPSSSAKASKDEKVKEGQGKKSINK